MSDLFSGVEPFVAVAEERSFRAAAARLEVTPGAISRSIAALEARVGTRLLNRTTRAVTLTPEGEQFLARAKVAVEAITEARHLAEAARKEARGRVRVSLSPVLAGLVTRRLDSFRRRYPAIVLHLDFTDAFTSLTDNKVDAALRIGRLDDSALRSRRIMTAAWMTVASRSYVQRFGIPKRPDELEKHACIRFRAPNGVLVDWRFLEVPRSGRTVPVRVRPALVTNLGPNLVDAIARGLCVGQVFDFMVDEALSRGELVELLPEYAPPGSPVHLLTMAGEQDAPRVRAFANFAVSLGAGRQRARGKAG